MDSYILQIQGHSAKLKVEPTGSKDTGIFIPQDLFEFLGELTNPKFRIFKVDCIKAMESIIKSLPLYSNRGGIHITHNNIYKECIHYIEMIQAIFDDSEEAIYIGAPFAVSHTSQNRTYLYGLNQGVFSIREFFIADHTIATFLKQDDGTIDLRFVSSIESSFVPSTSGTVPLSTIIDSLNRDSSFFYSLRTKPFLLLAGISGTGKSRLVRELAFKTCPPVLRDADKTTPGNYLMVEVKPNWHDSSELLGYYSNISKQYCFTNFVKFLVKAMRFPKVPFFVCLDEMNLAPVEQYFAEFLSVLETRKRVETPQKTIATGALVNKDYFQEIYEIEQGEKKVLNADPSDNDWYEYFWGEADPTHVDEATDPVMDFNDHHQLREKGLTLPANVFVIGTVNMDDTTHQFSRKVIDRAFTIEMNGGKLEDMFGGSSKLEYPATDEELCDMDTFGSEYVTADEAIAKCARIADDEDCLQFVTGLDEEGNDIDENEDSLPNRLRAINDALKNTPFQVSYRVFNELVIYLAVLLDEDGDKNTDFKKLAQQALDDIVLMKILPRVEGDSDLFMLGNSSKNGNQEEHGKYSDRLEWLKALVSENSKAAAKLDEMMRRMKQQEFTRFWP